jgi:hypothetical protein
MEIRYMKASICERHHAMESTDRSRANQKLGHRRYSIWDPRPRSVDFVPKGDIAFLRNLWTTHWASNLIYIGLKKRNISSMTTVKIGSYQHWRAVNHLFRAVRSPDLWFSTIDCELRRVFAAHWIPNQIGHWQEPIALRP